MIFLGIIYADDIMLVSESIEELIEKLIRWKEGMEFKGLRVKHEENKMVIGCENGPLSTSWPS